MQTKLRSYGTRTERALEKERKGIEDDIVKKKERLEEIGKELTRCWEQREGSMKDWGSMALHVGFHKKLKEYFAEKIPEENLCVYALALGEVPIMTRSHRKMFLIDKESRNGPGVKKGGAGLIRPTFLSVSHTPSYARSQVLRIIKKNNLKKYAVIVKFNYGSALCGAAVGHIRISDGGVW